MYKALLPLLPSPWGGLGETKSVSDDGDGMPCPLMIARDTVASSAEPLLHAVLQHLVSAAADRLQQNKEGDGMPFDVVVFVCAKQTLQFHSTQLRKTGLNVLRMVEVGVLQWIDIPQLMLARSVKGTNAEQNLTAKQLKAAIRKAVENSHSKLNPMVTTSTPPPERVIRAHVLFEDINAVALFSENPDCLPLVIQELLYQKHIASVFAVSHADVGLGERAVRHLQAQASALVHIAALPSGVSTDIDGQIRVQKRIGWSSLNPLTKGTTHNFKMQADAMRVWVHGLD